MNRAGSDSVSNAAAVARSSSGVVVLEIVELEAEERGGAKRLRTHCLKQYFEWHLSHILLQLCIVTCSIPTTFPYIFEIFKMEIWYILDH
jgi:hypothetical protein